MRTYDDYHPCVCRAIVAEVLVLFPANAFFNGGRPALPAFCRLNRPYLLGVFAYQLPRDTDKPANADEPCSDLNSASAWRKANEPAPLANNPATALMQDHAEARTLSIFTCALSVWLWPRLCENARRACFRG